MELYKSLNFIEAWQRKDGKWYDKDKSGKIVQVDAPDKQSTKDTSKKSNSDKDLIKHYTHSVKYYSEMYANVLSDIKYWDKKYKKETDPDKKNEIKKDNDKIQKKLANYFKEIEKAKNELKKAKGNK